MEHVGPLRTQELALALGVWMLLASAAAATIEVSTPEVGYRADTVSRVYRSGAYLPVGINIRMTAGEPVPVFLRVGQHDRDGDVVHSEVFATLSSNSDGGVRRHWLYYVPNPDTSVRDQGIEFQIIHAETGEAIEFVHEQEATRRLEIGNNLELIEDSAFFMLIISEDAAGPLMTLSDLTREEGPRFERHLRLANLSPDQIPDHWHGLETVDAIVWDGATPTSLSPNQLDALFDWVEHGGHLLITGSTTADAILQKGTFGSYIPARRSGIETVTELPNRLLKGAWDRRVADDDRGAEGDDEEILVKYDEPVAVALCTSTDDTAKRIARAGSDRVYAVSKNHKAGRVSFMAVTLHDVFVDTDEDLLADFVRSMFALVKYTPEDENMIWSRNAPVPLFDMLKAPISFSERLIIYVFMVIVFVAIYTVGSTWGTWAFLRNRHRLTYCWPVFAVTAACASFVSYGAVRGMLGIGYDLQQLTIIDTAPSTYSASAQCYFGIKTSTMSRLDFWLPSDDQDGDEPRWTSGYLRPLSPIIGASVRPQQRFADTKSYKMRSSFAELEGVPVRATLRQLEGYWHGALGGQIVSTIYRDRATSIKESRVGADSFVRNELGHDLKRCFLIETRFDAERSAQSRNTTTLIHDLGALGDGEEMNLAVAVEQSLNKLERPKVLEDFQAEAASNISSAFDRSATGLGEFEQAVLLVTTFREYDPRPTSKRNYSIPLIQENCRWLDRSMAITPDQFLFVAFANDPGPVELLSREGDDLYEPLRAEAENSVTVYRVTIPVQSK